MRIASFNIHHGAGASGPIDLAATALVIRALDADVVVIQEVDRRKLRSRWVDQAAVLGEMAGMSATFAPTVASRWCRSSAYGIAVLSREPLRDVEILNLPRGDGGREARVAVLGVADAVLADGERVPVLVAGTHLQANAPTAALEQLELLLERLDRPSAVRVIAGDLNLRPDHLEAPFAAAHFTAVDSAATYPSDRPSLRIDWVAWAAGDRHGVDVGATVGEVVDAQVSDHRPLVADLAIVTKI